MCSSDLTLLINSGRLNKMVRRVHGLLEMINCRMKQNDKLEPMTAILFADVKVKNLKREELILYSV